jgi:hypothetical protein
VEKLFKDLGEVAEGDAIDIDFTADGTTSVSFKASRRDRSPAPTSSMRC